MTTTPRVLEARCEWTSSDVADEAPWTESFDDEERLDELAARKPRLGYEVAKKSVLS